MAGPAVDRAFVLVCRTKTPSFVECNSHVWHARKELQNSKLASGARRISFLEAASCGSQQSKSNLNAFLLSGSRGKAGAK